MKTEGIYSDIAKYVKTGFDTSNYDLDEPLPKGENKKVMRLVKNELRGKVMRELKMYSHLKDDRNFWQLRKLPPRNGFILEEVEPIHKMRS